MKLCRFCTPQGTICPGITLDERTVLELNVYGVQTLREVLELDDPLSCLGRLAQQSGRAYQLSEVQLLAPIERQEIWAAGVTYERSRSARVEESRHEATAYDRVHAAARPELFFKCLAEKAVDPRQAVGIRKDARWTVPEAELVLVVNSRGRLVGYTLGNDMTARDLEGENLLYLPQAKIYDRSCAVGPWILLGTPEAEARQWTLQLSVRRGDTVVFAGEVSVGAIRRPFQELLSFLHQSQIFPHGVLLLTGTGIVPPADFALRSGDRVRIEIPQIGALENPVVEV